MKLTPRNTVTPRNILNPLAAAETLLDNPHMGTGTIVTTPRRITHKLAVKAFRLRFTIQFHRQNIVVKPISKQRPSTKAYVTTDIRN